MLKECASVDEGLATYEQYRETHAQAVESRQLKFFQARDVNAFKLRKISFEQDNLPLNGCG